MIKLNLPQYNFKIKLQENKKFIFDTARKKYVILSEEEWVRQHFILFLAKEKKYPISLMAVEKEFKVKSSQKIFRCDIVCFNKTLQPDVIVECKSPSVKITEKTFLQITDYSFQLRSKYLVVTNGLMHYYCYVDYKEMKHYFIENLPEYSPDNHFIRSTNN